MDDGLDGDLAAVTDALTRVEYLLTQLTTGEHPRINRGADQAIQRSLMMQYRLGVAQGVVPLVQDTEVKFFSQNGEDGILLFLLALLGVESRRSVEICAGDGLECNTTNLIVNHGFHGLLVDGGDDLLRRGRQFFGDGVHTWFSPPVLLQSWVTAENVNQLVSDAGFAGALDVLSLDLDGVDYWIWKALDVVSPRVVVAEYNPALGPDVSWTVPYDQSFVLTDENRAGQRWYFGASLRAMNSLAEDKGLRLVGVQRYGFNAFFVRHDIEIQGLPTVDPGSCFTHPAVLQGIEAFDSMKSRYDWTEV